MRDTYIINKKVAADRAQFEKDKTQPFLKSLIEIKQPSSEDVERWRQEAERKEQLEVKVNKQFFNN